MASLECKLPGVGSSGTSQKSKILFTRHKKGVSSPSILVGTTMGRRAVLIQHHGQENSVALARHSSPRHYVPVGLSVDTQSYLESSVSKCLYCVPSWPKQFAHCIRLSACDHCLRETGKIMLRPVQAPL